MEGLGWLLTLGPAPAHLRAFCWGTTKERLRAVFFKIFIYILMLALRSSPLPHHLLFGCSAPVAQGERLCPESERGRCFRGRAQQGRGGPEGSGACGEAPGAEKAAPTRDHHGGQPDERTQR